MKMKLYSTLLISTACLLPVAKAETLPDSDPRSTWSCVYPYTETNCQKILLAWAKDHKVPPEDVMQEKHCSGCDSVYFTDQLGEQHLLYAKCINRLGARFTQANFLEPIYRYRESLGDAFGWSVVDWRFEKCFETWDCGDYCSLETNPPVCLKYETTNWGLRVPNLDGLCGYGTNEPESRPGDPAPTPSSNESIQPKERDTTWIPLY